MGCRPGAQAAVPPGRAAAVNRADLPGLTSTGRPARTAEGRRVGLLAKTARMGADARAGAAAAGGGRCPRKVGRTVPKLAIRAERANPIGGVEHRENRGAIEVARRLHAA